MMADLLDDDFVPLALVLVVLLVSEPLSFEPPPTLSSRESLRDSLGEERDWFLESRDDPLLLPLPILYIYYFFRIRNNLIVLAGSGGNSFVGMLVPVAIVMAAMITRHSVTRFATVLLL
uniref:Uncharacterized protein n=1 Tax=Anopheles maculatus TaxID=74869 RepID=A0A182S627_9DIPT